MGQFGNWLVNKDGIEWVGPPIDITSDSVRIISVDSLLAKQEDILYDWPLHVIKASLTKEDIYAFNTAFIFALEFHNLGFPKTVSLMETFLEQSKRIKENEMDQPDELSIGGGGF